MNEAILKPYIRAVDPEKDKDLPIFSHSSLEQFVNCPYAYNLKYNEDKRSEDTTLALELGSLLHKILEIKGHWVHLGVDIDFDKLYNIIESGYEEQDEKTSEKLRGVKALKRSYFENWYAKDNASGMTYEEKLKIFKSTVLQNEMTDDEWKPVYFELPFEFVWNNRCIIHGFIDRVDIKDGEFRVVDYKTSKKVFDDSKVKTSQQFGIYACAILNMFGKLPIEYEYDFILLNQKQQAMSTGWEKRFIKKIEKILDAINKCNESKIFSPKPCPLCYYCNYCANNPNAKEYQHECIYFSLWTPTEKSFSVNEEFNILDFRKNKEKSKTEKRKIFF
jgi:ATP-dependent helicase/DNAse subunit B